MSQISPTELVYNFQGSGKYFALYIRSLVKNTTFVASSQFLLFGFVVVNLILLLLRKIVNYIALENLFRVSLHRIILPRVFSLRIKLTKKLYLSNYNILLQIILLLKSGHFTGIFF